MDLIDSTSADDNGRWNSDGSNATITIEITASNADEYWFNDEIWRSIATEIEDTYEEQLEKIEKWRTKMQGMYNDKTSRYNPVRHFTNVWNG